MSKHIITIARSYGSGGRQVARALSSELGYHYYDKELITRVSVEHGINVSIVNSADEKQEGRFKKYGSTEIASPDSKEYLSNDNIFNMTAKAIKDIAEDDENAIIVGRCAHHVLKDNPNVVKVFIHADRAHMIENVMKYVGCDREEAVRQMEKINKERAAYHKYYTNMDWLDARCYDLCLNTSNLDIDKCVKVIKEYLNIMDSVTEKDLSQSEQR